MGDGEWERMEARLAVGWARGERDDTLRPAVVMVCEKDVLWKNGGHGVHPLHGHSLLYQMLPPTPVVDASVDAQRGSSECLHGRLWCWGMIDHHLPLCTA